jgi:membrane fusion protein (multidrug efflux system)
MLIMLAGLVVVFGLIFGFKMFQSAMQKKYMSRFKQPTVTVSALKAGLQNWQRQIKAVGSLRAIRGVFVTSEVEGIVESIHFKPGDIVKKGALLVQLNADSDTALLHSLEEQARLAETVYERDRKQYRAQAISKETLDAAQTDMKSKRAQAEQQKALVIKKSITAPFDGKLGINSVNPGQFINPGNTIVSLQALESLYLDFSLPQQQVSDISLDLPVFFTVDAYPDTRSSGTITCINPNVDPATRNVGVEATVENPSQTLLPGMFVSLDMFVGKPVKYITVPQTAVSYNPYGDVVYTIENNSAKQVFVEVGETRGDQVAILKGIKEGDTVITAGQLKLRNGSPVVIDNKVQPSFDASPKPVDE